MHLRCIDQCIRELTVLEQIEESLSSIELFSNLNAGYIDTLGKQCRWRRYGAGQQIIGYQDESTDVFFIVSGKVRAIIYSISGKEVTFSDFEAGQTFGELAAIDGDPRTANVIAQTDALVASMPAKMFWRVLQDHPEVSSGVLKKLTGMVRLLSERVFEFSTLAVKNRIHAELLRLARNRENDDNTAIISPAPTHAEIASRISTQRELVTRELNALARDGLIERRGRSLVICDMSRLSQIVEEVLDL